MEGVEGPHLFSTHGSNVEWRLIKDGEMFCRTVKLQVCELN